MSDTLLDIEDLQVHFPIRIGGLLHGHYLPLKAVDGVSFALRAGETLGVVGESGCGKSTLGRAILQLIEPTAGKVVWRGHDLTAADAKRMRGFRRDMQIIFQDPLASLDPRMTIGDIVAEPLVTFEPRLARTAVKQRVQEMLDTVGLSPEMLNRYPHEFSGGQCQRIGIARAMILEPELIICDEPVSALDVSIQAQIINLLQHLQREFGLTLLFISHDLSVVRRISHRYSKPRHPYTRALISAVPIPDPDKERAKQRIVLHGDLPSPIAPPSGCVFRTRCQYADGVCAEHAPELREAERGHEVACHHFEQLPAA
jgi:oligopeptide transport system ATP-binding protein